MTGSVNVTTNPLPTLFTVTGGAACAGTITTGLSGSQSGVNYQLRINGTNSGATKAGTGSTLTWGSQSTLGSYTVLATTVATSCTQLMMGSATINPLPTLFVIGGGGAYCSGGAGVGISLSGDRKSTRLNSSHLRLSRMPSSA